MSCFPHDFKHVSQVPTCHVANTAYSYWATIAYPTAGYLDKQMIFQSTLGILVSVFRVAELLLYVV